MKFGIVFFVLVSLMSVPVTGITITGIEDSSVAAISGSTPAPTPTCTPCPTPTPVAPPKFRPALPPIVGGIALVASIVLLLVGLFIFLWEMSMKRLEHAYSLCQYKAWVWLAGTFVGIVGLIATTITVPVP